MKGLSRRLLSPRINLANFSNFSPKALESLENIIKSTKSVFKQIQHPVRCGLPKHRISPNSHSSSSSSSSSMRYLRKQAKWISRLYYSFHKYISIHYDITITLNTSGSKWTGSIIIYEFTHGPKFV